MEASLDSDSLLSLREHFYLGDFVKAEQEAKSLQHLDGQPVLEGLRDDFLNRVYLAQGQYTKVFKSDTSSASSREALQLLATYKSATDAAMKESVLEQVAEVQCPSDTARLVFAEMAMEAGDYKFALSLVHDGQPLEMKAVAVQCYLAIDRLDLASQVATQMSSTDDNAVLSSFAAAWVALYKGDSKQLSPVYESLMELLEMYSPTVPLLNLLAACQIHLSNHAEAFQYLKQARDLALQQPGGKVNADTLVNTIVCLQHLGKPSQIISKIQAQLASVAPGHPYIAKQQTLTNAFFKVQEEYKITN